jgi:hypothetical protein
MSSHAGYIGVGAAIGLAFGVTTGVAGYGTAVNGAYVFVPLGAFIGWLVSRGEDQGSSDTNTPNDFDQDEKSGQKLDRASAETGDLAFVKIVFVAAAFLATIWNLHISALEKLNLLGQFLDKPWLFIVLPVSIGVFFPPFAIAYFVCYVAAANYGASAESKFRANVS